MDKQHAQLSLDCMDYSFCFDATNGHGNHSLNRPSTLNEYDYVEYTSRMKAHKDDEDDDAFFDRDDNRDGCKAQATNPSLNTDEYRYINDNTTEIDRVKNKLSTLWNNVKYGWTTYVRKTKTTFDKTSPICILGRFYFFDEECSDTLKHPETQITPVNIVKDDYCYVMPTNNDRKYDLKMFEQDIYTRLWFTYRKDFPPINGTKYTSDCGWGCMLRSVQMLIAQGFLLHFLGREWNFLQSTSRHDHFLNREIISWFNDRPGNKCPFGIHRLINLAEKMGKKVGDWFGPGTVTLIMKDALEQAQDFITILDDKIRIYVAQDCTIYKKDVLELCTKNIRRNSTVSDLNVPFVPVLLLISVRLGGEDLNEIYVPILKFFLEMENCLGIIGGKPKHSLYMTGYQDDKVIFLDPHVAQDCINISDNNFDDTSFHCELPSKVAFNKLDPSLAIGFYCRTYEDFENFCDLVRNSTNNNAKLKETEQIHPIFSICDDYYEKTHLNYGLLSVDEDNMVKSVANELSPPKTFKLYPTIPNNSNSSNKFLKINAPRMNFTKLNKMISPQRNKSNTTTSKEDDFVLL